MNQRRVRVLPRSESRRGEYAAKPRQRGGKAQILGVHIFSGFTIKAKGADTMSPPTIRSVRTSKLNLGRD